jgi:hypothetical protein
MNKINALLTLIFFLLASKFVYCQLSYTLTTQSQVDSFQYIQMGYINGLNISGPDITNLNGLSGVTHVNGSLNIIGTNVSNLNGLNNLIHISSALVISGNPLLNDISALDSLDVNSFGFPGAIIIEHNPSLTAISSFNKLKSVYFLIKIANNQSLTEINGFNALDSVGEYLPPFCTAGLISIDSNFQLQKITGFGSLKKIGSSLTITSNHNLNQITGFNSLDNIGCGLFIQDDSVLVDLSGFSELDTVFGDIRLENIGIFNFESSLSNLKYIGKQFNITNNKNLLNINGLNQINTIKEFFVFESNIEATSLNGLNNTQFIGGISIAYNLQLNSISEGFNALQKIGQGGFYFHHNDSFQIINGFNSVDSILGNCNITNNISLTKIMGFNNLKYISEDLFLGGVSTFIDFSPIDEIEAFDHPIFIGGDLTIKKTYLSNCAVISVCDYLAVPSGIASILVNQTGCNTPAEVINTCIVDTDNHDAALNQAFSIFPNPASVEIIIQSNTAIPSGSSFKFYNLLGQFIAEKKISNSFFAGENMTIDISDFQNGLYVISLCSPVRTHLNNSLFMVQQ